MTDNQQPPAAVVLHQPVTNPQPVAQGQPLTAQVPQPMAIETAQPIQNTLPPNGQVPPSPQVVYVYPNQQPPPGYPPAGVPPQLVAIPQPIAQGQQQPSQAQQPISVYKDCCFEMTPKPRSTQFLIIKYLFIMVIIIRLIFIVVYLSTHSKEMMKQIKIDIVTLTSPIIVYVFLLIGSFCENYNIAFAMPIMLAINLVFSIIRMTKYQDTVTISGLVLDVITIGLSSYYAYLIRKEGGSMCKLC